VTRGQGVCARPRICDRRWRGVHAWTPP
jgi:hypothetical protein